jgi:iron complex outermembrane receptor protein
MWQRLLPATTLGAGAFLLAGAALAQSAPTAAPPKAADTATPSSPSEVTTFDTVVVTARKRAELAQSVPIAVTVLDQSAITRLNITTLADLQTIAPSVFIQPSTFRQDTINITIRGQQNFQSTDLSFDTATAVYVDGVYYARPVGLTGSLFDVDSVQVLKGPQGTLVGRNSTGGAILYQTRDPTDQFGGYIRATGGDYQHEDIQGSINLPLTRNLWFRAALDQTSTQGYIKNDFYDPVSGYRNNTPGEGVRKLAGNFSLKWAPDDTLTVTLRGAFDSENDTGSTYHDLGYFVGTTLASGNKPSICNIPATCSGFTDLLGHTIAPYYVSYPANAALNTSPSAYNALLNSVKREQADGFWSTEQAISNDDVGHYQTVSGVADKAVGDIDVRLTGAYRWFNTMGDAVSRGLPYATNIYLYDTPDYQSYQSELTVNGASFANRVKWTAGLFFFRESSPDDGDQLYLFLPSGITPSAISGKQITYTDPTQNSQQNTSYAAYAQATWSIRPNTRVTGGLRYTEDIRQALLQTTTVRFPASIATTATVANGVYSAAAYTLDGITYAGQTQACALTDYAGVLLPLSQCRYNLSQTFQKPTWTFSIDHDLAPGWLAYFTTRSGYRSGGINAASINPGVFTAKPEDIMDYELGIKSDWRLLGMPVRANLDAYYSDYHNIQIQTSLPNVTVATTTTGGVCTQAIYNAGQCLGYTNDNVTLNARAARIEGAEWDVSVKPVPPLTVSVAGSYLDAVYTNYSFTPPPGYLLPVGSTNFTGTHFPLPAWQINDTVAYALPVHEVAGLRWSDLQLTWHMYWQSNNEASLAGYNSSQLMKGYALSNFRLDVRDIANKQIDFSAYVTNAFNRQACVPEPQGVLNSAPNATFGTAGTSGVLQCVPLPPRMYGVTLAYNF